jgi:hypothetical protein
MTNDKDTVACQSVASAASGTARAMLRIRAPLVQRRLWRKNIRNLTIYFTQSIKKTNARQGIIGPFFSEATI